MNQDGEESGARSLLPEEKRVGSEDARREAEIILEDSDARTEDPERARRESSQSPDANTNAEP